MDWITVSIVIACLLVSAFFAASETALTGASKASMGLFSLFLSKCFCFTADEAAAGDGLRASHHSISMATPLSFHAPSD